MDLQAYRRLLADLDSEFHKTDVKSIKFLCEPSLRPKNLFANIHSGLEIFNALEKSQLLGPDDLTYLAQVLHIIGRVDLATQVDPSCDFDQDSVLINRLSKVDPFRTLLFRLSEDLGSNDVTQLRFLYQKVPKKVNIDEGIDLFTIMLQHQKISSDNLDLLKQFLHDIERKDLVGEIEHYEAKHLVLGGVNHLGFHGAEQCTEVHPVAESLYSSGVNLESSEPQKGEKPYASTKLVENEMFSLKQNIGKGEQPMDESPSPSDNTKQPPFSSEGSISMPPLESSMCPSELSGCLPGVEICTYPPDTLENLSIRPGYLHSKNDNIPVSGKPASLMEDPPCEDVARYQQPVSANAAVIRDMPSCQNPAEPLLNNTAMPAGCCANDDDYTPLELYKMNAVPRGICLVVDNHQFHHDPTDRESIKLNDREGSKVDRDSLTKTFERLGFTVHVLENRTDHELCRELKWYSLQDHGRFDCFVCCILSHGGENYIFGSNGHRIELREITSLFRAQSCPSLAGKPKLFFMATCRGKDHQYGVDLELEDIQQDAPTPEPLTAWIPNEADFLFGYSTVMNYVSYRSRSKGTFYVNELTKVLDKYADREDIHTLLTRVNDEVSKRVYQDSNGKICKQIPAPQHTLRKTLRFLPLL